MSVLGFFDSGFGGLSVIREVRRAPEHSLVYLSDNARSPYGGLSARPSTDTRWKASSNFSSSADIVVLACNTSSSVALRRIQQHHLAVHHPNKRVLGIVIPTAEEVSRLSETKVIGVLATEVTVNSYAYPQELHKISTTHTGAATISLRIEFLPVRDCASALVANYSRRFHGIHEFHPPQRTAHRG